MLKKLATLSLSLLICLSLLPGQASAMDAPENEPPVQTEDVENQDSPNDADVGIAPYGAVMDERGLSGGNGFGVSIGAGDQYGNGASRGFYGP